MEGAAPKVVLIWMLNKKTLWLWAAEINPVVLFSVIYPIRWGINPIGEPRIGESEWNIFR